MIIDMHVHVSALTPEHGKMSEHLLKTRPFRFMQWRLGIKGNDERTERAIAKKLATTIDEAPLDAAVILAFDAVYDTAGRLDEANTHLYAKNDYVIDLARGNPKMLFGASVHPYRKDALEELDRCAAAGAVLMKWLPIVQGMNPADERCFPFYDALVRHRIPLLSHTGGEKTLPNLDLSLADPALLKPALERGVTVIAAHCGTRSAPGEHDYLADFVQLCRQYDNLLGDTAALCLPTRSYAFPTILNDPIVRSRLVHGSDWPVISIPPITGIGIWDALRLFRHRNWMQRDILTKQKLGFDKAYWHRAAKVLRMPKSAKATGG